MLQHNADVELCGTLFVLRFEEIYALVWLHQSPLAVYRVENGFTRPLLSALLRYDHKNETGESCGVSA